MKFLCNGTLFREMILLLEAPFTPSGLSTMASSQLFSFLSFCRCLDCSTQKKHLAFSPPTIKYHLFLSPNQAPSFAEGYILSVHYSSRHRIDIWQIIIQRNEWRKGRKNGEMDETKTSERGRERLFSHLNCELSKAGRIYTL